MKIGTFFILSTRHIFTKLVTVSESSIKIEVRSDLALFVILLISAVICKQKLLDRNEIVQYLQNSKCYNVDQDGFRKPLKKELSLNGPYNFQRPFNFSIL